MAAAGAAVPADGLARLELDVGSGVSLLPRGRGLGPPGRMEALAGMLAADPRPVVADCGVLDVGAPGVPVAAIATQSLLVIRPCYLSLRRMAGGADPPVGHRAGGRARPRSRAGTTSRTSWAHRCRAEIAVDPAVARVVDAGMLASRAPQPGPGAPRVTLPLAA